MEYSKYLKSKAWDKKRKAVIKRADNRCMVCYSNGRLNVHHRTYERIFKEKLTDLIALCDSCHKLFHKIMPIYKPKARLILPKIKDRRLEINNIKLATCKDDKEIKRLLRENAEIVKANKQPKWRPN